MKFFLDSAKTDEIKHALTMWNIDGITSNPKHILTSGKPFMQAIKDIAQLFEGTKKPISVEVNPHHTNFHDMVDEAKKISEISSNFVIKIPATEAGFKACWELSKIGIPVNLTLVFSPAQALQAARMGAQFVSPFLGWKESNGEDISALIGEIMDIYQNYNYTTEVIVAAARNARHLIDSALVGADCITAGFDVYQAAFEHPYTDLGLQRFSDSWDKTPYEAKEAVACPS